MEVPDAAKAAAMLEGMQVRVIYFFMVLLFLGYFVIFNFASLRM
jgi:hypothetical protein